MNIFQLYLNFGIHHIADIRSYDHILFITCLCAVYLLKQWRQILVLITAFTIGHTTSLVLATLKIVSFPTPVIEFLIPLTIFITAFWNLFLKKDGVNIRTHWFKYATALFFGLIHGLGFSNYLQILLGKENSILMPLFSFNVGIEAGQIIRIRLFPSVHNWDRTMPASIVLPSPTSSDRMAPLCKGLSRAYIAA